MSNTISFGMWLRQQPKRHDLTQAELAGQVGGAVGTLRNIETDSARPSKQLAARLAKMLGVADENVAAVAAFARGIGSALADWDSPPDDSRPPPFVPNDSRRANLPAQLTGLIGRTHEVTAVRALLLRPDVRLVTLTGPSGTGKTRVAVQIVTQSLDAFPDGVYFVDLAAIIDPDLVLVTIAQTLGVTESPGQTVSARLAVALRDRGDAAGVREYCEPSLAILRELGMQWAIGFALNSLALGAYHEGDLARAFALADESLALFRGLTSDASLAEVLITLGQIVQAQGIWPQHMGPRPKHCGWRRPSARASSWRPLWKGWPGWQFCRNKRI